MGTCVTVACCVVVISCLVPPATPAHKNKIIVKVPHLVKHIHHDHLKPIHMHKVRAKKIEHHYHDEHEDTQSGWKHGKKTTKKGNQKLHGSFSNLKPILLHQEIEEHMEYPEHGGEMQEFEPNQRVGHRLEFKHVPAIQKFSKEEDLWNFEEKPPKWRPAKFREEGFSGGENFERENIRPKPIDFSSWLNEDDRSPSGYSSGETWDTSSEDLSYNQNPKRNPINKQSSNNKHKNQKAKNHNWRSEDVSTEMESHGWKPMVEFNPWENFNAMRSHSSNSNNNKQFIDSGEYVTEFNDDLNQYSKEEERKEHNRKKKRKQNRKKSQKFSQEIVDSNKNSNHEQVKLNLPRYPYQLESPQSPILPQALPQFFHPLQTQQVQPYSLPAPETQKSWAQPYWTAQQPAGSAWPTQPLSAPQPQPQPTVTPKVVWSGHHLQMPQHSMWHVQQHSDGAPPLQMLTVNQNPLQALQFHQHPSLPQQLTQESSSVHQVVPPDWPLTRKSQDSSVKQQWEQHVQTTGSDGPASSYRVEVINYTGKKSA